MAKSKVLIVEDDRSLSDILVYNLQQAGFNVFTAFDGRTGIEQAKLKSPDIILLDLMLPQINGLDVCRHLRKTEETKEAGIIMLTARSEDMDQIGGFEAGADDYVVKPYSVGVLLERIRAVQRRRTKPDEETKLELIRCLGVELDLKRYRTTVLGQEVELTRSEFKLLLALIQEPGRAFDRNELIESALGEDTLVLERTIDVHVRALRRKLGELSDLIETVRGVGYRFREPREEGNEETGEENSE